MDDEAMLTIMAAFAQLERDTMIERTRAGLAAAAANGRKGGRPRKVDDADAAKARQLRERASRPPTSRKCLGSPAPPRTATFPIVCRSLRDSTRGCCAPQVPRQPCRGMIGLGLAWHSVGCRTDVRGWYRTSFDHDAHRPEVATAMLDLKPMTRTRVEDDGTVTTAEILADVHGTGKVFLAADADIEVGDELTFELPNGKPRTIKITEHRLYGVGTGMDHTKCLYEDVTARPIRQPKRVNLPGLHNLISDASGGPFASQHYDEAVFNAFKAVEDRVKKLSGNSDIGKRLMTGVFSEQAPALDITSDNADADQKDDEREGFKFLFMGAAQGLRNPRGHGPNLYRRRARGNGNACYCKRFDACA